MEIWLLSPLLAPLVALGLLLATQPPLGLPRFQKVNERLYRGAQPTTEGIHSLASLGVKTIVDLRGGSRRSAAERKVVEAAGMRYVYAPLSGYFAPPGWQVARLLAVLNDEAAGPVFVHCRRGIDRTGTIIACYRIAHDHWDNRRALGEAEARGMRWISMAMKRYVLRYVAPSNTVASAPAAASR
jgi:protein tyrosine/serine phosphatase